jgi:membrane protein
MKLEHLKKQAQELSQAADRFFSARLGWLKAAMFTFSEARAAQAAASVAYYAFFSLFPFLLVCISIGSYFVDEEQAFRYVTDMLNEYFPAALVFITNNLRQVFNSRGAFGILGLLTLFWSASSVFASLAFNINLAWTHGARRGLIQHRLIGLGMIAGLTLLLILSLAVNWLASLEAFLRMVNGSPFIKSLWWYLSILASWVTVFLLLLILYRWAPRARPGWRPVLLGALVATGAWKGATALFNWYLKSLLRTYQLIYGSLGAIVLLLLLIYILAFITLFGAHLVAAMDRHRTSARAKHSPPNG